MQSLSYACMQIGSACMQFILHAGKIGSACMHAIHCARMQINSA